MKWRPKLAGDIDKSPQISHKPLIVEQPMVAMVKRPTHFELIEQPSPRPVRNNHIFHWNENGWSRGSENFIQAIIVKEMKKRRGESNRINRLFATKPFSIGLSEIRHRLFACQPLLVSISYQSILVTRQQGQLLWSDRQLWRWYSSWVLWGDQVCRRIVS